MLPPSPPAPPAAPAESVMPPAPMLAPSIEEKPATPPPTPFYPIYVTMCRRRGRPFGRSHASVWRAGFVRETGDRKSVVEGKRVSVRVDLGGRRIINKNKTESTLRYKKP